VPADDELVLDERERPGNADEDEVGTSDDEEAIEPAEAGGPPDHAKARGRR